MTRNGHREPDAALVRRIAARSGLAEADVAARVLSGEGLARWAKTRAQAAELRRAWAELAKNGPENGDGA